MQSHVLSHLELVIKLPKVAEVKEMKRPETVTQVKSFLGSASYYRKFVKYFSKIAKPLLRTAICHCNPANVFSIILSKVLAALQSPKEMKRPETVTQVKSFLGSTSYYRKFVKYFSKIAKPLFNLTKEGKEVYMGRRYRSCLSRAKK
jgi:methyltransferase-like protein